MSAWTLHQSKSLFSQIRYLMEHHPIATNSILSLHLWLAGDLSAQYVEHYKEKREEEERTHAAKRKNIFCSSSSSSSRNGSVAVSPYDLDERVAAAAAPSVEESVSKAADTKTFTIDSVRAMKSASYGAFVTGPLLAVWYPFLDRTCQCYQISSRYGVWGAPVFKVVADEFIMDPPFISMFFAYMNICEGGTRDTFQNKLRSEFLTTWLTSLAIWPPIMLLTFRYLPVYATAPIVNAFSVAWDGFLSHRNAISREVIQDAAVAGNSAEDPTTTKKDISPNLIPSLCSEIN